MDSLEETVSELQEALRTASEAGASGNEARLQEEIETLKVIIHVFDDSTCTKLLKYVHILPVYSAS